MQHVSSDKKIGEWFDTTPRHAAEEVDTYIRRRFSDGWRSATRAAFRAMLSHGAPPARSTAVTMDREIRMEPADTVGAAKTRIDAAIDSMSSIIDLAVCRHAEDSIHAETVKMLEAHLREIGKELVWILHPDSVDTFRELKRRLSFQLPGAARKADGTLGTNPYFVVPQLPGPGAYVLAKGRGTISFPEPLNVKITRSPSSLLINVSRKAFIIYDDARSVCEVIYAPTS
jgi:hypothetical protein